MAIGARKFRIRGVDMNKIIAVRIDLLQRFAAALREYEVTRSAITRHDGLPIGGLMIAIMTTETAIPVLMSDVVSIRAPVGLHLGEKILAIDDLRFCDEWIGLLRIGIGRVQ